MTLAGTRPPTVDEWEKYELHHRARLAAKPGLTGMWQVSGRSNITDFEEVVELDREYISHWSMGLDLVGDVYQIESIYFGNWFEIARNFISSESVFELIHPYRTQNKNKMSSGEKLPLHFLKNNTGIKWK